MTIWAALPKEERDTRLHVAQNAYAESVSLVGHPTTEAQRRAVLESVLRASNDVIAIRSMENLPAFEEKGVPDVHVVATHDSLRIYIDDLPHVIIGGWPAAMSSWIERGQTNFVIEFTLDDGASVTCEYEKREMFVEILRQLDKVL